MIYPHPDDRFSLGVNYWPRSSAMYMWKMFDRGEIADDMALIADLGLDSARIFLLWEDFQPTPDQVSGGSLELLVQVADAAGEAGVLIQPTLFVGHMSGGNYIPEWALAPGGQRRMPTVCRGRVVPEGVGQLFTDPALLAAQRLLAGGVAEALAGHPALGSWDLANELDGAYVPESREDTVRWAAMLYETLKEATPDTPVTIGMRV